MDTKTPLNSRALLVKVSGLHRREFKRQTAQMGAETLAKYGLRKEAMDTIKVHIVGKSYLADLNKVCREVMANLLDPPSGGRAPLLNRVGDRAGEGICPYRNVFKLSTYLKGTAYPAVDREVRHLGSVWESEVVPGSIEALSSPVLGHDGYPVLVDCGPNDPDARPGLGVGDPRTKRHLTVWRDYLTPGQKGLLDLTAQEFVSEIDTFKVVYSPLGSAEVADRFEGVSDAIRADMKADFEAADRATEADNDRAVRERLAGVLGDYIAKLGEYDRKSRDGDKTSLRCSMVETLKAVIESTPAMLVGVDQELLDLCDEAGPLAATDPDQLKVDPDLRVQNRDIAKEILAKMAL